MHPMNKEAHFEAKKDLRNHPTLNKRANPNIGIEFIIQHYHIFILRHLNNFLFGFQILFITFWPSVAISRRFHCWCKTSGKQSVESGVLNF